MLRFCPFCSCATGSGLALGWAVGCPQGLFKMPWLSALTDFLRREVGGSPVLVQRKTPKDSGWSRWWISKLVYCGPPGLTEDWIADRGYGEVLCSSVTPFVSWSRALVSGILSIL
ncbi:hypothetical protein L7F22_041834 [Adiantum nelumboides]|nr:hypothetical protein [Adiantum nelumboides]